MKANVVCTDDTKVRKFIPKKKGKRKKIYGEKKPKNPWLLTEIYIKHVIRMDYIRIFLAFLSLVIMALLVYYLLLKGIFTEAEILGIIGAISSIACAFMFYKKK